MDTPKEPTADMLPIKHNPNMIIQQYYSLPSPIFKYMLENAPTIVYYKLYQSCKLLQNIIEEKYGPQIDILEAGKLENNGALFFSLYTAKKEIKMRGSEITYEELPKAKKLSVKKRLLLKLLSASVTKTYLQKLNLSMIKEVYLLHTGISIYDYKKLLVPSIEVLYATVCTAADEFDIIPYTMTELPNLKIFRLPWQKNVTTFAKLNVIKRSCKLQKAEIYELPERVDEENNLRQFMTEQMAPGSSLYLNFPKGVPQSIKNKCQNFADEFNASSTAKIMIR